MTGEIMNNRIAPLCLALLFIFLVVAAQAQEHPSVTTQPNTVYVGADGKFEAPPDTVLMQFEISAQEETSKAAYEHGGRAADQVRQLLRSNGIDPKTAEVGFFSLQPVYDYKTPKRRVVGYRVNSSVSLKLRDFSKIGPIAQQLADIDVTGNQSVNYILENMEAAKLKAIDDAYQRARAAAAAIAGAAQRSLGDLSYATVDTFEQPRPVVPLMGRVAMAAAGGTERAAPTEGFAPQKVTVTAHVNAVFSLK
jgi:uncharacterized protein YggE